MNLTPVESSMISAVGYDESVRQLIVLFNSGKTYCYFEVPKEVFEELMAADSKGRYMRAAVIDCYSDAQVRGQRHRR